MAVIKNIKAIENNHNHLLGIQDLSHDKVIQILDQAKKFINLNIKEYNG